MSENQLKALLEAIKTDNLLKKRLKDAADLEAVVAIASEAGFDVTTSELQVAQ
jgi:predicted ribosomally synthesized peptide with nif11-like leader